MIREIYRYILKTVFGKTDALPYLVDLKEIIIDEQFQSHPPKKWKLNYKIEYYNHTGRFLSPILINRQYVLKDGYTSYIIAQMKDINTVPVYFVD